MSGGAGMGRVFLWRESASWRWAAVRRPVLRAAAGRLRRRSHQVRAAREPVTPCASGAARQARPVPVVADHGAQQEVHHPEPARREGQELARRLLADADILVENFRPGTLERWNLGYDRLAELNPGLIMVRVSGFGQTGPYAAKPGFGSIGEAMGGLRYVVGDPSRRRRTGISIGDSLGGVFAALGAVMALLPAPDRPRAGGRLRIYEAVLAVMESLLPEYEVAGTRGSAPARPAERRPVERLPHRRPCCSSPRTRTPSSVGWRRRWTARSPRTRASPPTSPWPQRRGAGQAHRRVDQGTQRGGGAAGHGGGRKYRPGSSSPRKIWSRTHTTPPGTPGRGRGPGDRAVPDEERRPAIEAGRPGRVRRTGPRLGGAQRRGVWGGPGFGRERAGRVARAGGDLNARGDSGRGPPRRPPERGQDPLPGDPGRVLGATGFRRPASRGSRRRASVPPSAYRGWRVLRKGHGGHRAQTRARSTPGWSSTRRATSGR